MIGKEYPTIEEIGVQGSIPGVKYIPADAARVAFYPFVQRTADMVGKLGRSIDKLLDVVTEERYEHGETSVVENFGTVFERSITASTD